MFIRMEFFCFFFVCVSFLSYGLVSRQTILATFRILTTPLSLSLSLSLSHHPTHTHTHTQTHTHTHTHTHTQVVFGGTSSSANYSGYSNDVWFFDLSVNTWQAKVQATGKEITHLHFHIPSKKHHWAAHSCSRHSLTHSLILTHSHSLTHSHPLTHSLTHSHSLILTDSLILTHHSLTDSHTTQVPTCPRRARSTLQSSTRHRRCWCTEETRTAVSRTWARQCPRGRAGA